MCIFEIYFKKNILSSRVTSDTWDLSKNAILLRVCNNIDVCISDMWGRSCVELKVQVLIVSMHLCLQLYPCHEDTRGEVPVDERHVCDLDVVKKTLSMHK